MTAVNNISFSIALDIGTTNIKASLYALNTHDHGLRGLNEITTIIQKNDLSRFGSDVLSRISAGQRIGFVLLYNALQTQIFRICTSLAESAKNVIFLNTDTNTHYDSSLSRIAVTANTVMLHFFTGKNPSGLALYPFIPDSLFGYECEAEKIFSADLLTSITNESLLKPETPVYIPPCIDAFVGSDAVCASAACGFSEAFKKGTENILLCDIGTNAETMLLSCGSLYCCSAAAGPAFEKGLIKNGMSGSSLITVLADMLRNKIIDNTGFYSTESQSAFEAAAGVHLSQKNIRSLQLAKAAVFAGIAVLLRHADILPSEIKTFYICGALGAGLNPVDAAAVGLFPAELTEKIVPAGDAALRGVSKCLIPEYFDAFCREAEQTASRAQCIQLGGNELFTQRYIGAMNFPDFNAP